MNTADQELPPDEEVYQSNKSEPQVNVVYSTEEEARPIEAESRRERGGVLSTDADEISAESFPASDAPPTPVALPKKTGDKETDNPQQS